jgi:hypothetical protein
LAARPLNRLPALLLAWTLALLIAPALAHACPGAGTANYIGPSGGNWNDGSHWSTASLPTLNQIACVPAGSTVVVDIATAQAGALTVESTAGVTISGGQKLTIGGGTIGIDSALNGAVAVDGTLDMKQNVTLASPGSMSVNGTALIDALGSLTIADGLDITGGGVLQYDGLLLAQGGTAADPVAIAPQLHGSGTFSSAGASPSPVELSGGSIDTGTWELGSGDPAPSWTLNGGVYSHDGPITDVDSGGLGQLVMAGAFLQNTGSDTVYDVYRFDVNAGSDVDFTLGAAGTAHISADYLTVDPGAGHLFEVAAPVHAQELHQISGTLLTAQNKEWTTVVYRWEGGALQSTTPHSGMLTVTGALDMSGAGTRGLDQADLVVTGVGSGDYQYTAGTFTLSNSSKLTIGSGVHFNFGADVDIAGTATETIDNGGIIDKQAGAATGSTISPQVLLSNNGELWVTNAGTKLTLALDPDTLVGGVLTGTYILDGELVIPGAVTGFGGNWQMGASGLLTAGGVDATTTIDHNAANSTITVDNTLILSQNFTNNGTINVATGSLTVSGGKSFTQAAGTLKLSTPGAGVTFTGPATIAGGTLQGVGQVDGSVVNSGGTVAPGNSPGTLTINGDFTQNGTGLFSEEIDGPAAGQFDKLVVTGTATLGGTLVIASTNGYQAPDTQQFQIVDAAGGITGTWGGIVQSPFVPWFDQVYAPNTMVLIANSVSVSDAAANEGSDEVFTISLGQASPTTVSVGWATQDGTAGAGSDFSAASGTVTFAPGETSKTVAVPVTADGQDEPSENFAVNLSNPVNTRIRDANGVGTIGATATAAQVVPPGDIDGFATPPPPIRGKAVNVEPVRGSVLVRLPGAAKFVPLPDAEQVPVGTIVDATKGTVRLFSVGKGGRVQFADFFEGVFQVLQKPGEALTVAKLVGGSFAGCPRLTRASAAAKRKKTSSVRHLWGSGSGQFRTAGRYASATIRGTKWLTDDRCNGTLIRVTAGSVTVRDLTLKKSIVVKRPESYLAPAVKPKKRR